MMDIDLEMIFQLKRILEGDPIRRVPCDRDTKLFCEEAFPSRSDVAEFCHTAITEASLSHAVIVTQYMLPGRTIDITIYDGFTGCRIDIPGHPACCYMAKDVTPSSAVLIAAFAYVLGENDYG